MPVIVYSKHGCVQCTATKRRLVKAGVTFQEKNVEESEEALAEATATGIRQMPIVVTDIGSWGGFQPTKIDLLKGEKQ